MVEDGILIANSEKDVTDKSVINKSKFVGRDGMVDVINSLKTRQAWEEHYINKPPTINEFLTEEWIGDTAESIYPYIKEDLIDFWSVEKPYTELVSYSFRGAGKTVLSVLSMLFQMTHVVLMKDACRFFGLPPNSNITFVVVGKSETSISETFGLFINDIVNKSPKLRTILSPVVQHIIFCTHRNLKEKTIGKNINIISLVIQDCDLFDRENFYFKLEDFENIVRYRFADNYFARTIYEARLACVSNPTTKFLLREKPNRKILKGAEWEYKTWQYEDETKFFFIFIGNEDFPEPRIIKCTEELSTFVSKDIITVPLTLKPYAEKNLEAFLIDRAGELCRYAEKKRLELFQ